MARPSKKKRKKNQINKIRNDRDVTTDNAEIQKIIRDYHEQLYHKLLYNYSNKMDNMEETDRFLDKFNLPRLNQEEIEIVNSNNKKEIVNNPITSSISKL